MTIVTMLAWVVLELSGCCVVKVGAGDGEKWR